MISSHLAPLHELRRLNLRFDPNQPRIPAGEPGAGQWTSGGGSNGLQTNLLIAFGGTNAEGVTFDSTLASPAASSQADGGQQTEDGTVGAAPDGTAIIAAASPGTGLPISIIAEDQRGGHTYEKHVNQSEAELLRRVREESADGDLLKRSIRSGSFPSLEAADKLVSATLAANEMMVVAVASGVHPKSVVGVRVDAFFRAPTGIEAFAENTRVQPRIRTTYGVGVFIRRDEKAPNGFTVISAYPRNLD